MSEYLGKLEVVEVNDGERALELTLFYKEESSVRTVKFNKQSYDTATNKYVADAEQYEKYEKNCREILGVEPSETSTVVGQEFDVWETDTYCALWEIKTLAKFDASWAGQILTGEISEIRVYDAKAQIVIVYDGKEYGSNINYGTYVAALKKSLVDPQKKAKQLEKFKEKFGVDFDERETLIGKDVLFEVKKNNMDSTGKNPTYVEIKPFPRKA